MRIRPRKTTFKLTEGHVVSDVIQYEGVSPDLCMFRSNGGIHCLSFIYGDVKLSPQELRWLACELDRLNNGG